ncbi:MAG: hypothetical protein E7445_08130 [Ruminococcaceae bacterium]|nr:hypothetical protein [Oscillospiraceae bacterium]
MESGNAPQEKHSDALAVCQSVSGITGFAATLLVSPLVDHIQSSGNMLFGFPVHAQQVVSLLGVLFTVVATVYLRLMLMNRKSCSRKEP